MNANLHTTGYRFDPSKYSPPLGYSRLEVLLSGKPSQRYFDVKTLRLPTFDGRYFHQAQVTRHELSPVENLRICLGPLSLEPTTGEALRAFSFGGVLQTRVEEGDLVCELTSSAPIFKLRGDPKITGGLIAEELMDLLAEKQARLAGHEDELYSRLARIDPYQAFLASMVSLQKRLAEVPASMRREKFRKVSTEIQKAMHIVQQTDGWDGKSPGLDDLL